MNKTVNFLFGTAGTAGTMNHEPGFLKEFRTDLFSG
jgi:hypothetical protein